MKVFAIWSSKTDRFIAAFPNREDAMNYGIVMFGPEDGWEYDIREMFLTNSPQYPLTPSQTIPCKVGDVPYTPYTPPITVPSPPYSPNIWCGGDAVKDVKATYEWNETGDGV